MDEVRIEEIIEKHQGRADALIQILLELQSENRWLTKETLAKVSERLEVPLSRIQHVATFYKAFSLVPKGRHEIHICLGLPVMSAGRRGSWTRFRTCSGLSPARRTRT